MQDKEMFDLFKSLDGIAPPAGVRERILNERILKEKDTPVNDIADEASVFSIIEDKRLDITPPVTEYTETDTTPSEGEEHAAAAVRQPRLFMWLGAAAACIVVIVLGVFAVNFYNKGRLTTGTPSDNSTTKRTDIFDKSKSLYTLLTNEVTGAEEDDADDGARQAYQIGYDKILLMNNDGSAVVDGSGNIYATSKDICSKLDYLTCTGSDIFVALLSCDYDAENNSKKQMLEVFGYDASTLEPTGKGFGVQYDDADVTAYCLADSDYTLKEPEAGSTGDDSCITLFYSTIAKRDDGSTENTVYRQRFGKQPEKLYTITDKNGAKTLTRIEGIYTSGTLNVSKTEDQDNMSDIFIIYSETSSEPQSSGLYKVEYHIMALDTLGIEEPATAKLFDDESPFADSTFEDRYTAIAEYETDVCVLNKSTGVITTAQFIHGTYEGENYETFVKNRHFELSTETGLVPIPGSGISSSRYSIARQKCYYDEITLYVDEDGRYYTENEVHDFPERFEDKKLTKKPSYMESDIIVKARVDYDSSGSPISSTLVKKGGSHCEIVGEVVSAENGSALLIGGSGEYDNNYTLHTPSSLQRIEFHQ